MFVYGDVPGIDPEKLYRANFTRQYGLCCCNMAPVSFLFFCKKFGSLARIFWANGLTPPPPPAKNFPYAYARNLLICLPYIEHT